MAIERNVKVVIAGENAKLEESIYVYQHDRGIDLTFDILQNKFSFTGQQSENIIRNNEIMYAGLTIKKPSGEGFFRPILPILENKVVFRIEHSFTNDFDEIGMYTLQIHLYDKFDNRISIPPFKLEVKPLIVDGIDEIDGKTARADEAIVDVSVVAEDKELFIIEYTDGQGYVKTEWKAGEVITASRLNNLESGIENAFKALEELEIPSIEGLATEDFVNAQIALSKEELEALLESNKTELEDLVETTKEELEGQMQSIREELEQVVSDIEIPSIDGLASEEFVEEKVNSAKEELKGQIDDTKSELEEAIGNIEIPDIEGLASEDFVEEKVNSTKEDLQSFVQEEISKIELDGIDTVNQAIAEAEDRLQEATIKAIWDVKENASIEEDRLEGKLQATASELQQGLRDTKDDYLEQIQKAGQDMTDMVEGLEADITEGLELIERTINQGQADINTNANEQVARIRREGEQITTAVRDFELTTNDAVNRVNEAKNDAITSIQRTGASEVSSVNSFASLRKTEIRELADEKLEAIENAGAGKIEEIEQILGVTKGEAEELLQTTRNELNEHRNNINATVAQGLTNIENLKGSSITEMTNTKDELINEMLGAEIELKEDFKELRDQYVTDITNLGNSKTEALNNLIDRISDLELEIERNLQLSDKKAENLEDMLDNVDNKMSEIRPVLDGLNELRSLCNELKSENQTAKESLDELEYWTLEADVRIVELRRLIEMADVVIDARGGNHEEIEARLLALEEAVASINEIISEFENIYATKEELLAYATKEDLLTYATKEELEAKFNTIGIVGESAMPACYATAPEPENPERDAVLWIQNRYGYNFVVHVPGYKNAKPFSSYISVSGSASFDSAYIKNDRYSISYVYRWDGSQWALHSESSFQLLPVRNQNDTIAYAKEKLLFHCTEDIFSNGTYGSKYFDKVDKPTDIVYGDYNGAVTEGKYIVNHEVAIENCPQDYAKGILQVKVTKNEKLGTTEIFQEVSLLDGKTYKRAKDKANVWTEWSMSGGIDLGSLATREELHQAIADIDFPETDLSNYYNKQEADEATTNIVNTTVENYHTKDEVLETLKDYATKKDLEKIKPEGMNILGKFVTGSGNFYIPENMKNAGLPTSYADKEVKHTMIHKQRVSSYDRYFKTFFFVDLDDIENQKYVFINNSNYIRFDNLRLGADYVQLYCDSTTATPNMYQSNSSNTYTSSINTYYQYTFIYDYDFDVYNQDGTEIVFNSLKTKEEGYGDFNDTVKDGYYLIDMDLSSFMTIPNAPKISKTSKVKGFLEVLNGVQTLRLKDGQVYSREINGAWCSILDNTVKNTAIATIGASSGSTPELFKDFSGYWKRITDMEVRTLMFKQNATTYTKVMFEVNPGADVKAYLYMNSSTLTLGISGAVRSQIQRYTSSTDKFEFVENASGTTLIMAVKNCEIYATDFPIYLDSSYTRLYKDVTPVSYAESAIITNMNDAIEVGTYGVEANGNVINAPVQVINGMLEVSKSSNGDVYQVLKTSDNISEYCRVYSGGKWSIWTKTSADFVGKIGTATKYSVDKNGIFNDVPTPPTMTGVEYMGKIMYSYGTYYRCVHLYKPLVDGITEPFIYLTTSLSNGCEALTYNGQNFTNLNSIVYYKNVGDTTWSETYGWNSFQDTYNTHIHDNTVPIYTDVNKSAIYREARTTDKIANIDACNQVGKYLVNITKEEYKEISNLPNIVVDKDIDTILYVTIEGNKVMQEITINGVTYTRTLGGQWVGLSDTYVKTDIVDYIAGVEVVENSEKAIEALSLDEIFNSCPYQDSHKEPNGTIDFKDSSGRYYRWRCYGKGSGFFHTTNNYIGVYANGHVYTERYSYSNGVWTQNTGTSASNLYVSVSSNGAILACDIDVVGGSSYNSIDKTKIVRKADVKDVIIPKSNFNDCVKQGAYKVDILENTIAENSPVENAISGIMEVTKFDNAIKQVLTTTEGTIYTRVSNGEMWSEWASSKAQGSVGEGSGESVDLSDYYTKSETYNKNEVDELIENIDIPDVNLDNYYTKGQVDELIDSIEIPEGSGESVDLSDYHTKEEIRLLNNKNTFYDDNYNILIGNETTPIKLTELNKLRPNPSYKAVGMYINGVAHLAFYLYPAMRAPMYYVSGSTYKLRIQYSDNKSYLYKLVDKVWQEVEIPEKAIYDLTLPGVIKMSDIFVAETGIVDNLSAMYGAKPLFDSTVYSYNLVSNNGFYRVENGGSSYFPEPNGILEVVSSIDFRRYTFYTPKKTYVRYAYTNRDTNGQNNGGWKEVDNTSYDITKYYTKTEVDKAISNIDIPEVDLSNYPTVEETNSAIQEAINAIPPTDLSDYSTTDETVELINSLIGVPKTSLIEQTNRIIEMLKGEK